jgi:hypothetical protein
VLLGTTGTREHVDHGASRSARRASCRYNAAMAAR